jgi:HSP20 family protein
MAIIRFSPFAEIDTLRRQMDRMFDDLVGFNVLPQDSWKPAIELIDNENSLKLRASLPGVEAKNLDVSVTRDSVTISGEHHYEKTTEDKGYYHSEFSYGKFQRTVALPVAIKNEEVVADFKDGILTLTLPKLEEAKDKVVKISLGGEEKPAIEG